MCFIEIDLVTKAGFTVYVFYWDRGGH
jgi:hypothetical protein